MTEEFPQVQESVELMQQLQIETAQGMVDTLIETGRLLTTNTEETGVTGFGLFTDPATGNRVLVRTSSRFSPQTEHLEYTGIELIFEVPGTGGHASFISARPDAHTTTITKEIDVKYPRKNLELVLKDGTAHLFTTHPSSRSTKPTTSLSAKDYKEAVELRERVFDKIRSVLFPENPGTSE
jgi:hypothetical protein